MRAYVFHIPQIGRITRSISLIPFKIILLNPPYQAKDPVVMNWDCSVAKTDSGHKTPPNAFRRFQFVS